VEAQDTSANAKYGGVITNTVLADPANFDYYNFDPNSQGFANITGAKLFRLKPGHLTNLNGEIETDLAESYEFSPDKLTLTVKLHPQAKFSPLSSSGFHAGVPDSVANRQIDADDVVFSWNRLITTPSAFGGGAGELSNKLDPSAPIESVTAIDNKTVQFKMVRPHSPLMVSLANGSVSFLYIIPKEGADDKIDFLKTQIGGGPFYIEKYEASSGLTLKRNPNFELRWSNPKLPYVDEVDLVILGDVAATTAQFRTGALLEAPNGITLDDRIALKKDNDNLVLYLNSVQDSQIFLFGQSADSPFTDVRMRQAVSLSWDRDAYGTILHAVDKLDANGVPAGLRWNTCYGCYNNWDGWWLDPQDSSFGENAKYYTLGQGRDADIAECKKLMMAAIGADTFETDMVLGQLSPNAPYEVDVLTGVMKDAGFKLTSKVETYGDFLNSHRNPDRPLGDWYGLASTGRYSPTEPSQFLRGYFAPSSNRWLGVGPEPPYPSKDGDPYMNNALTQLWSEFDTDKRIEIFHDFQRYHAKMNYGPLFPGGTTDLVLAWPALGNPGMNAPTQMVFQGSLDTLYVYNWLDKTKPPLA
jgi:ABC-type transport system substrate-binding protein